MANEDIEIEIKFPLQNPNETKQFLNENAKLISEDIYQKDIYYVPNHRDFLAVKYPFEWLRLRKPQRWQILLNQYFPSKKFNLLTH